MGNVLIVGWNRSFNYGTNLQAIALADAVSKKHNVSLLWQKTLLSPKMFFKKLFSLRHFEKDFHSKALWKKIVDEYDKYNKVSCNSKEQACNLSKEFSTVLVGSDQLWNPFLLDDAMLLDFLPSCNKVSYATSLGVGVIPEDSKAKFKTYLSRFSYLSVREKTSAEQLTELLQKPVETALDPVFLKTKDEWQSFGSVSDVCRNLPSRYLLCYFVGDNNYSAQAFAVAEETTLPIVVVPMNKSHLWHNACVVSNADLRDFVSLVDNATAICTDSFHLSALSLIFNKDFYLLERFSDLSAKPNIRTDNLFETFVVKLENNHAVYDKENVNKTIKTKQEQSLSQLYLHLQ